jgi:shikimate dehydrogenase
MPYKIDIIPYLDRVDTEAAIINAVNCIYRDDEELVGTNTDGAGALWALQRAERKGLNGQSALLIGTGGAGLAVATYIASSLGSDGQLILSNRTSASCQQLAGRLADCCKCLCINWPPKPEQASEAALLINCTSVGFESLRRDEMGAYCLRWYTPLGPVPEALRADAAADDAGMDYLRSATDAVAENVRESLDFLSAMNKPLVMDIIYQPRQTMLLHLADQLGYRTINGVPMNLEQAVIAFDKVTATARLRISDPDKVRRAMKKVY